MPDDAEAVEISAADILRWADKLRSRAGSPETVRAIAEVMELRALRVSARSRARANQLAVQVEGRIAAWHAEEVRAGRMSVTGAVESMVSTATLTAGGVMTHDERQSLRSAVQRELARELRRGERAMAP